MATSAGSRYLTFAWDDLPVGLENGKGFASDDRLEITYAYNVAPHHPALQGLGDAEFSLWGADYYVAHRCFATPQEGNAVSLLVAGTDRAGLTSTPLLELGEGRGCWLVSTLELIPKLSEEPRVAALLQRLAACEPRRRYDREVRLAVAEPTLRLLREVGFAGHNAPAEKAPGAEVTIIDGSQVALDTDIPLLRKSLAAGQTVLLHDADESLTRYLLTSLDLPGTVVPGSVEAGEHDTVRHTCDLADGMTSNYLYWIVNKARVAMWTRAPLHPAPASACIQLPKDAVGAASLTRRGAAVAYQVGPGRLIIDNLQWQSPDFDEPERPRRWAMTLLSNLGVPLAEGTAKRLSQEFETEAERRERGHF